MNSTNRVALLAVAAMSLTAACSPSTETGSAATSSASGRMIPTFRVDTDWPRLPAHLRLGEVSSVAIDAEDNAWLIHRAYTLPDNEMAMAAPRVVGFDPDGNYLRGWGGPGEGYQWPQREHRNNFV